MGVGKQLGLLVSYFSNRIPGKDQVSTRSVTKGCLNGFEIKWYCFPPHLVSLGADILMSPFFAVCIN